MNMGNHSRIESPSLRRNLLAPAMAAISYPFLMAITKKRGIASAVIATYLAAVSAIALPGDGHWDRQFNMPGTTSRDLALRFNGNLLYTGGYSMTSGQIATNTVVSIFNGTNWSKLGE